MDNILQSILKKLEGIDGRLKQLEVGSEKLEVRTQPKLPTIQKKDELFEKAWSIINKSTDEEVSTEYLSKALGVDEKRADAIFDQLEQELERVKQQGFAFDEEEFLPGLLCLGILIPSPSGASNMGLAIQAPMMRFSKERALSALPALRRAAEAISKINSDLPIDQDNDREFQAA